MLLAALACVVSTDIAELRDHYGDRMQRACGQGIQSISITGNHERLLYSIEYVGDWKGRIIAQTVAHTEAARMAIESCKILRGIYPAEVCAHQIRDGKHRPVCATEIALDGSGATVCVDSVGEDE